MNTDKKKKDGSAFRTPLLIIFLTALARCDVASPSVSSRLFGINREVKVLLLIVCGLFSQLLPFGEVITLRQVGGALGAVPQLWSIRLEIPSSSALGLRVCTYEHERTVCGEVCVCVCVCLLSLAARVCI